MMLQVAFVVVLPVVDVDVAVDVEAGVLEVVGAPDELVLVVLLAVSAVVSVVVYTGPQARAVTLQSSAEISRGGLLETGRDGES
jgi:hypothetical protein